MDVSTLQFPGEGSFAWKGALTNDVFEAPTFSTTGIAR
jgi:hypothetical protein